MKNVWMYLPPFAPDYSGVCSALFELNGLLVIHDAAGCTGNYTGFDEPRWYGSSRAIYCSGIRKTDVVLGDEEKTINRIVSAAQKIRPDFIAVVGSPVPMVIGTDFEGLKFELEERTGRPTFGFDTTGTSYYNEGVAKACIALIQRFTREIRCVKKDTVNVLGATPLDISLNNNRCLESLLQENGFSVHANFSLGITMDKIRRAGEAAVNLAVSQAGVEIAQYMEKRFGMPYVAGLPVGRKTGGLLMEYLRKAQDLGETCVPESVNDFAPDALVIGDAVFANSVKSALVCDLGVRGADAGTLFGAFGDPYLGTVRFENEQAVYDAVNDPKYGTIVADPLINRLVEDGKSKKLVDIAHYSVSSKHGGGDETLYISKYLNYIRKEG